MVKLGLRCGSKNAAESSIVRDAWEATTAALYPWVYSDDEGVAESFLDVFGSMIGMLMFVNSKH